MAQCRNRAPCMASPLHLSLLFFTSKAVAFHPEVPATNWDCLAGWEWGKDPGNGGITRERTDLMEQ